MNIFDSLASLETLPAGLLRRVVVDCVGFDGFTPDEDGFAALIEEADVERVLVDLGLPYRLCEVPFETVRFVEGHHVGVFLADNQFAIVFLVSDAPWLPSDVRRHLENHTES
jgi:hypothetical protein